MLIALAAVVTIRGRRLTGWVAAVFAWRRRHRNVPDLPSEPAVGATVHAGRSRRGSLAGRLPGVGHRAGPPAVHADGDRQRRGLHRRRRRHPVGRATGGRALPRPRGRRGVGGLPGGQDRACEPGRRSTSRSSARIRRRPTGGPGSCCGPTRNTRASRRSVATPAWRGWPGTWWRRPRGSQISWPATALTRALSAASTISTGRPRSASSARPGRRSRAAAPSPRRTAPRAAPTCGGRRGPTTRSRGSAFVPGAAPTTTVLLTTLANPSTPRGFSCLFGGQRAALQGISPVTDRHYELPIGSAGVLVGETADRYPVYMPFDDVDVSINLGDARLFTQFVVRSAAAGAVVTLRTAVRRVRRVHQRRIGQEAKVAWPNATTYLGPHPGIGRVVLRAQLHRHAAASTAADPIDQPARGKPLPDGSGTMRSSLLGRVSRRRPERKYADG